jgi:pimeloyl-ACP methyl ester carboxylesterase
MRFVLESGRRVGVHFTRTRALWPDAEGGRGREHRLVVFCHSAPGAGPFDPNPAQTHASNVTLLAVDRPGYGRSDPVGRESWATVASAADDIAAVVDSLGAGRVGVVGWSAGGRVALALAARRPDLVGRVVVAATPAPDEEVAWVDPAQRVELERLRTLAPAAAHAELQARLGSLVPEDPFSADALWLLAAVTSDEPALGGPGVRGRLGEMLRAAFAQGTSGLAADIAGYCLQPWGFEPEAVEAKTLLLYGSHDPLAGPRHGEWWRERLPDARLEVVPDAGHLLVIPMWPRVLAHLVPDRDRLRVLAGLGDGDADAELEEFTAA